MQQPFASVPSDIVEKVREVERVVPVVGRIRVGGARATRVSFLFFFLFFLFELLSLLLYEKERRDSSAEGRAT